MKKLHSARVFALVATLIASGAALASVLAAGQDADTNNGIMVTGSERLAWNQVVESPSGLAHVRFLFYVDDAPIEPAEVTCDPDAGSEGFSCSSALPVLTPGEHIIEVSAILGEEASEGPRSAPMRVVMVHTAAGPQRGVAPDQTFLTRDGIRLSATVVATGLDDAIDLTILKDGRVAIAERAGRIRLFRPDNRSLDVAATLTDVEVNASGSGLLAIAASGQSDRTSAIYVVYTTGYAARLARFVADEHGLSARAILLDGLPVSRDHPRASLRIGPDLKLYLGLDDAGNPQSVGDWGSLNGKVLRLNVDGTTPPDASTWLFATGMNHPAAMAWTNEGSVFWLAGASADGADDLQRNTATAQALRSEATRFRLPLRMATSAMLTYRGDPQSPLDGNLLIAGALAKSILRARVSATGAIESTEWLFDGQLEDIRAMTMDASGTMYVCAGSRLIRVTLQR